MHKNVTEVKDKISSMLSEMTKFVNSDVVVGKPIKSDDITIIPLVDVTFGLGFGYNGQAKEDAQGGGMGGKISPNSLLVIENGQTKLVNVKDSNSITALIPQILDRLDLDFIKKPGSSNKKVRFEDED
ncbi:MAG: GerW family sporulation protein [Clostridia bacterium]|nr:GerW family sporulation protein [Clostridia bacterium]